jgi:cytochrome c biogenesis protein ResB
MRSLFKALKSLKLAIVLLAYFAATGIAVSFIPQGRGADFYRASMPSFAAELALNIGFTRFYGSPLFLVPAFIFFANLSACAAHRFLRELRKSRPDRRHGPDLVHFGLVLLVASVVAGQVAQQGAAEARGFVKLKAGEAVQLSSDRILLLKSLRVDRYPDGRPRDFVSVVELWKADGTLLMPEREIGVNHPLRLGALSVRQASFDAELAESGLMAGYDPLFPAVLASLALTAFGIFMTLAQKLRRGELR